VKDYLLEQLKTNESVKFKVVYFDFNKSNLNLLSLNELKLLVEFLNEHPETKIEIAGHGDNKGSWETNLSLSNKRAKEVYDFLIDNKFKIFATTLQNSNIYYQENFQGNIAIIVGTEATGLSDFWKNKAHQNINIPMEGKLDSMNVSVAAAIVLFEAKRQRV
jgi:hypothetical protein